VGEKMAASLHFIHFISKHALDLPPKLDFTCMTNSPQVHTQTALRSFRDKQLSEMSELYFQIYFVIQMYHLDRNYLHTLYTSFSCIVCWLWMASKADFSQAAVLHKRNTEWPLGCRKGCVLT